MASMFYVLNYNANAPILLVDTGMIHSRGKVAPNQDPPIYQVRLKVGCVSHPSNQSA